MGAGGGGLVGGGGGGVGGYVHATMMTIVHRQN